MSALMVIATGPGTSVQDGGRVGAQRFGLPPSGAMDHMALAMANTLVGNTPLSAAIELGPFGAEFAADGGSVRLALAGAARSAEIAGQAVAANRTLVLEPGAHLRLGPARDGVFSYLAVEGGIHGEPMFGSLAVNVRAGLGSPYPRGLRAGDVLDLDDLRLLATEHQIDPPAPDTGPIRVVLGPQDDEFSAEAIALLLDSAWTIAAASDRMGYRIEGPRLAHDGGHNIVSDGTVTGSIQVPGSGQPIVLMADRGTTGGYPKIATVVSADLGRFAQHRAGDQVRFRAIDIGKAQATTLRYAATMATLPQRLSDVGDTALDLAALHHANLAGVAVSAIDAATWQASRHTSDEAKPAPLGLNRNSGSDTSS
jgi:biotin-dependent carboxylase-like uncharacterized protein